VKEPVEQTELAPVSAKQLDQVQMSAEPSGTAGSIIGRPSKLGHAACHHGGGVVPNTALSPSGARAHCTGGLRLRLRPRARAQRAKGVVAATNESRLTHGHSWADEEIVIWVNGRDISLWARRATSAIGTSSKSIDPWSRSWMLARLVSMIFFGAAASYGYGDQAGGD
jgi:hypothetical protein